MPMLAPVMTTFAFLRDIVDFKGKSGLSDKPNICIYPGRFNVKSDIKVMLWAQEGKEV
jgi:hypothetical protein